MREARAWKVLERVGRPLGWGGVCRQCGGADGGSTPARTLPLEEAGRRTGARLGGRAWWQAEDCHL